MMHKGITKTYLAQKAKLSRTTISKILNQKSNLKFSTAVLLAKALDISFVELNNSSFDFNKEKPAHFNHSFSSTDYLGIVIRNLKTSIKSNSKFQKALSTEPGLSEPEISKIFSGRVSDPYLSSLEKLVEASEFDDLSKILIRGKDKD